MCTFPNVLFVQLGRGLFLPWQGYVTKGWSPNFEVGRSALIFSHIFLEVLRKTIPRSRQDYCRAKIQTQNIAGMLISFDSNLLKNNGCVLNLHIPQYPFTKYAANVTSSTRTQIDKHFMYSTLFALKLTDLKRHTSL